MVKLHDIRQLAVKQEPTPGTAETGFDATDLIRVRELTFNQNPQYFDRNIHKRGFGYTPRRQENTSCELTFAVELAGNTANAGSFANLNALPTWATLLRACGFRNRPIYALGVNGGISGGPVQHGEVLTGGTSGAVGASVGHYYAGDATVYMESASGPFTTAETVAGGTSGASFAAAASPNGGTHSGFAWYPDTTSQVTCTVQFYNDGDLVTVSGCRGDVTVDCQSQDIALLRFTLMGIYESTSATALIDDTVTGAYPEAIPPTFVDAGLSLFDGTEQWSVSEINFTEAQFTMGNNVVMRQNSNSASGWLAAHIANRTPNGRFNPDDPGAAIYNIREKFKDNARMALRCGWGSTVGNSFRIEANSIEFDAIGDSDRDEVQSLDLSFRMTLGFESGADTTSIGDDNEFVLYNV